MVRLRKDHNLSLYIYCTENVYSILRYATRYAVAMHRVLNVCSKSGRQPLVYRTKSKRKIKEETKTKTDQYKNPKTQNSSRIREGKVQWR